MTLHQPKTNQIQLKNLSQVLKGGPINAYSNDGDERKTRLHYTCKRILATLAKDIGLKDGTYRVTSNMGGIAVCGEISLVTPFFRVHLDDGYMMKGQFYYRKETEDNQPGFTASTRNRWWKLADLISNYPAFVEECRKVMTEPNTIER